ncbi:GIY-YIG nuclease family protein [Myceligenerans halotolerans]
MRWPVKEVISIATGVARTRFNSQAARRWLPQLGFTIGSDATGTGLMDATPRMRLGRRAGVDVAALELLDQVDVAARFTWLRAGEVTLDEDGIPAFPALPDAPGLYRFDFGHDEEGTRVIYVGESVSIRRRASNYRNAKTDRSRQRTSRRIHKEIVSHLGRGGTIAFAIADEVVLAYGGPVDLRLRSGRRLAENAAVLAAQLDPAVAVLNIDTDLSQDDGRADENS